MGSLSWSGAAVRCPRVRRWRPRRTCATWPADFRVALPRGYHWPSSWRHASSTGRNTRIRGRFPARLFHVSAAVPRRKRRATLARISVSALDPHCEHMLMPEQTRLAQKRQPCADPARGPSVRSECRHRINARCASCRNPTCENGGPAEQGERDGIRQRV